MVKKKYPSYEEEESTRKVSEPVVGYAPTSSISEESLESTSPNGYNGFFTNDPELFKQYKSDLIAEAMDDGIGLTWNEVRQQIKEQHSWL